mmetsp:Transcript_8269/g.22934  ORF Transcript_8269/g.22934 Transcript_8269/m.22934 type:complete len:280 (+) Transcript_8269:476-1315(+)
MKWPFPVKCAFCCMYDSQGGKSSTKPPGQVPESISSGLTFAESFLFCFAYVMPRKVRLSGILWQWTLFIFKNSSTSGKTAARRWGGAFEETARGSCCTGLLFLPRFGVSARAIVLSRILSRPRRASSGSRRRLAGTTVSFSFSTSLEAPCTATAAYSTSTLRRADFRSPISTELAQPPVRSVLGTCRKRRGSSRPWRPSREDTATGSAPETQSIDSSLGAPLVLVALRGVPGPGVVGAEESAGVTAIVLPGKRPCLCLFLCWCVASRVFFKAFCSFTKA